MLWFCSVKVLRPGQQFSVMLGRSHASWVFTTADLPLLLGSLKCLAQGHYTAVMGFEPWTSSSGVQRSTTRCGVPLGYALDHGNFRGLKLTDQRL